MEPTAAAPEALTYDAARARVHEATRPLPEEEAPLDQVRGRALRRAVICGQALPPFRNASMDGVAVRSPDLAGATASHPIELPVAGSIAAGDPPGAPLAPGRCAWITTGAPIPDGADAVVPVEEIVALDGADAGRPGGRVRFVASAATGRNARAVGADLGEGEMALAAGRELSAHDVALLAALGVPRVAVGPRPRVAVISTGDELLSPEEPARPGAIRDSNRPMMGALLEECGARVVSSERIGDDPERVVAGIERALEAADVVITMGGVSAGAFDPVKLGAGRIAGIRLWRVAMKPGRPQAFGTPRGKLFFGLPGNPGSVACVFEVMVRPALRRLQGFSDIDRPRLRVRVGAAIESRPGRTDFARVTLSWRDGVWWAAEAGAQVSGHLTPQSRAHALLIVPEPTARLAPGNEADALLLRWPGTA